MFRANECVAVWVTPADAPQMSVAALGLGADRPKGRADSDRTALSRTGPWGVLAVLLEVDNERSNL